jgi:SnoaL-like protein
MTEVGVKDSNSMARWSVGGIFLEGLAARDFARLGASLAPGVQFRALLPPGPAAWEGADAVAETFRSWFGDATDFELVDATVGEVGGRLHLSWRLRVRPAPFGIGEGWHVIEQQAYADAGAAINAIDLLCSGFTPEADRSVPTLADVER